MAFNPNARQAISLLQLLGGDSVEALMAGADNVDLLVPDAYLSDERLADASLEALAIQRLLTLASRSTSLMIRWEASVARRILASPAVHPLAALTLCLHGAQHHLPLDQGRDPRLTTDKARSMLLKHRLQVDMFSDSQVLVCVDHEKPSLPADLYDVNDARLLGEDQFESFVDDFLTSHYTSRLDATRLASRRLPTAVMIRELIENTHDHARSDISGRALKPNGLRGLIVKRVLQERRLPSREASAHGTPLPCLELSVFDSGIGYYESFVRAPLGPEVPIAVERDVLLKCLARHSDVSLPDERPGHRGMGLYEVLRALQRVGGLFEVRTGRIHGYRSFLQGEWKLQLEPESSTTRPGMPKPVLLDMTNRMLTRPTPVEHVIGAVVRVVVPLT